MSNLVTPEVSVSSSVSLEFTCELAALLSPHASQLHSAAAQEPIAALRARTADWVANSLRRNAQDPCFEAARRILSDFRAAGVSEFAAPAPHVALADSYAARGWAGVIAGMLLVPAWQWPNAPRLRDVPQWLIPLVADYLFSVPQIFTTPGQEQAVTERCVIAVSDLAALVGANRGSQAVQTALEAFGDFETKAGILLRGPESLKLRAARAQLIAALNRGISGAEVLAYPRAGRRLRIGIVMHRLESSSAAMSLVPLVERLDISRFETVLLIDDHSEFPVADYLVSRGATIVSLPMSSEERVLALRDAMLDIAVFVADEGWVQSSVIPLSFHRIAPVQLVHDGSGLPTFLPTTDLFIAEGPDAARAADAERAVFLPGNALLRTSSVMPSEAPPEWTREAMGLDASGVVFTAAGTISSFTADIVKTWAAILARIPESRLVIAVPTGANELTNRFCGYLGQVLARHTVAESRVSVFSDAEVTTHQHRRNLLKGTDVLLELQGDIPELALAAMEAGVAVITLGGASRRTAALLQLAGASDLIAVDAASAGDAAYRLTTNAAYRAAVGERLVAGAVTAMAMHDPFVRSETLGRLLEQSFDAILTSRRDFSRTRSPLHVERVTDLPKLVEETQFFLELGSGADAEAHARVWLVSEPTSLPARRTLAAALKLRGLDAEAAALWITVVEMTPQDSEAWFEVAAASRQCGKRADTVEALEMALRLNPKRVDAWLMLASLAKESGNLTMQTDTLAVLKQIAPDDPKVTELAASLAA